MKEIAHCDLIHIETKWSILNGLITFFSDCLVSGESKLKSSNHPNHLDSVSIESIFIYILLADTLSKQKFTFRSLLFDRISQHAIFDLFKTEIKNTFFFSSPSPSRLLLPTLLSFSSSNFRFLSLMTFCLLLSLFLRVKKAQKHIDINKE